MNQNPFAPPETRIASDHQRLVRWGASFVSALLAFAAFNAPVLVITLFSRSTLPDFLVHPGYLVTISSVSLVVAFTLDRFVRSRILVAILSMVTLLGSFFALAAFVIITR